MVPAAPLEHLIVFFCCWGSGTFDPLLDLGARRSEAWESGILQEVYLPVYLQIEFTGCNVCSVHEAKFSFIQQIYFWEIKCEWMKFVRLYNLGISKSETIKRSQIGRSQMKELEDGALPPPLPLKLDQAHYADIHINMHSHPCLLTPFP